MEWAASILSAVGTVVALTEEQLDAVTGLSGSGPAYIFLVAEAMVEAGVDVGLERETAEALVEQTILGAGQLLVDSEDDAAQLRAHVTSPGGTTQEGIGVLEAEGVRRIFRDAIVAATERSRELGSG